MPDYPHGFVRALGDICLICGLDKDDSNPIQCIHEDPLCLTCPRAHVERRYDRAMIPSVVPSVGMIVHYVNHGTPYRPERCRAAIVVETGVPGEPEDTVYLAVVNPTGLFFPNSTPHEQGYAETPKGVSGCASHHEGGTWHWPDDVIAAFLNDGAPSPSEG